MALCLWGSATCRTSQIYRLFRYRKQQKRRKAFSVFVFVGCGRREREKEETFTAFASYSVKKLQVAYFTPPFIQDLLVAKCWFVLSVIMLIVSSVPNGLSWSRVARDAMLVDYVKVENVFYTWSKPVDLFVTLQQQKDWFQATLQHLVLVLLMAHSCLVLYQHNHPNTGPHLLFFIYTLSFRCPVQPCPSKTQWCKYTTNHQANNSLILYQSVFCAAFYDWEIQVKCK